MTTPTGSARLADVASGVAASVRAVREGGRPPEDDRFRATDDEAEAAFIRSLAAEAAEHLEGEPADRVLAWAAAVVPRFAVTSSFGAESAVLLSLLAEVAPEVPVLFLDTGLHFPETLAYRDALVERLGSTVLSLRPDRSVEQQAVTHGDRLWERDPDRCCGLRKTTPLRTALRSFDGWATGVRRSQTPERSHTPVIEARPHDGRWLVKVAPLAAWTDAQVAAHLADRGLPPHPLVADGYRSIGCQPCTRPAPGDGDGRAGRWAAFDGKTECGIHLPLDPPELRRSTTPG